MTVPVTSTQNVRRQAVWQVIACGIVAASALALLLTWQDDLGVLRRGFLLLVAVPSAWFLIQLVALITGVPFVTMAKQWDSLRGWQRLVLGLAIIAIAFVGFATVAILIVSSLA